MSDTSAEPFGVVRCVLASPFAWVERHFVEALSDGGQSLASGETLVGRAQGAELLVRVYFAYLTFLSIPWSSSLVSAWKTEKVARIRLDLWFTDLVPLDHVSGWMMGAGLALTGLSLVASLLPQWIWARAGAVLSLMLVVGFRSALKGKIDHGLHLAMWVGFALCFLPRRRETEASSASYLGAFFGAQLAVGLLYSCAGISKLLGVLFDAGEGLTWFSSEALPLTLVGQWHKTRETLLGGFLVEHPLVGRLVNPLTLALELLSFVAVQRPRLHRFWGVSLTLMHLGILHTMRIHFHQSIVILFLVLICSPLAPKKQSLRQVLLVLPLVPTLRRLLRRKRERAAVLPAARTVPRLLSPRRAWFTLLAVVVYLMLSFGILDVEKEDFRTELYPTSPMYMFWKVDDGPRNLRNLERAREELTRRHRLEEKRH